MKKSIIFVILFLSIGFAAVSTTLILNGTINVGTNEDDFDVYFSNAILDGEENLDVISSDKKTINFETRDLSKVGDKSILEYEVTNASTQYDANVSVTCTPNETDLYKVINTQDKEIIEARTTGNGIVTVELKKNVLESQKINFTCTITANAIERESTGEGDIAYDENFVLEGTYMDKDDNAIPNANLVIYSDTPHYVTTDTSGNLLVSNLERGKHEIYHVNDTLANIKNMTKEQIIAKSVTQSTFTTSDNNIIFPNNNSISSKISKHSKFCSSNVGREWNFGYTGKIEEFQFICEGNYKLETWGAQGYSINGYNGGFGAYATGEYEALKDEVVYVTVGQQGSGGKNPGFKSFSNGGTGGASDRVSYAGSGGGSTHILTNSGYLSSFLSNYSSVALIVAAGGGSGTWTSGNGWAGYGGHGGGIQGVNARNGISNFLSGGGATQKSGGTAGYSCYAGTFGFGGSVSGSGAGGGGGLYGGGCSWGSGGGGGSSYIGNPKLTNKIMYCYNCVESTEESTSTKKTNEYSANPESNKAKQGNGYAKITLLNLN